MNYEDGMKHRAAKVAKAEARANARLWLVHDDHGCDSGCCGHAVVSSYEGKIDFVFGHPHGVPREEWESWARQVVAGFGSPEQLDWARCELLED